MNKKIKYSIISSIILSFALCLNNGFDVVHAGDNGATKPTVKYASEYSESYYSDIRGLSGDALLEGLATISISNHQTYTSYDQIRGGNAFSDEDPSNPDYMLDFYTGLQIPNAWDSGATWNREHVWCQSLSGGLFGTSGAGSDIHHIRPLFSTINGDRSNGLYKDLPNTSTYEYKYNGQSTGCYRDGTKFFEPRDESKGDVARILMYLYMHYSDEVSANSNYSYAGGLVITNIVSTDEGTKQAAWNLLMDWNNLDPVDTFESNRNNYCTSVTGLRNPFIDHPEFATMIWNSSYSGSGALEDSSSSIEEYLKLASSTLNLVVGNTYQINPSTNISNPSYTYISSNESVATISSTGLITALSEGETTITVSCNGLNASLLLTVYENTNLVTGNTVKYTVSSKNSVTANNEPANTSATYTQTYSTAGQITSGNSTTLTLSGYEGLTITSFTLSMRSNSSKGSGSLSVTAGATSIYEIEASGFNTSNWNGAYSSSFVDISRDVTTLYEVQAGEKIIFTITATVNSLYIDSYSINYSTSSSSTEEPKTLSLNETSLSLNVGETYQLNPITNISDPNYNYTSSQPVVANISSTGLITALSTGVTTITVECEGLEASLELTVIDELNEIKAQVEKIETKAELDFGYTYTQEGNSDEVTVKSNVTTNTYLKEENVNYASEINLDSEIFNVYCTKGNPTYYTCVRTDGNIRVYAERNTGLGNTLTIELKDNTQKINSIAITETSGATLTITDSNGNVIEANNGVYQINDYMFNIQNTQVGGSSNVNANITSIVIDYGKETINYNYFGDVKVRYSATIPNEIMEKVDSYGVNITVGNVSKDFSITNLVKGSEESSFAAVLKNIEDYTSAIIVTAFIYIDGNRIELISKSYSILNMVDIYITDAVTLGLTNEQVNILTSFKSYIQNI